MLNNKNSIKTASILTAVFYSALGILVFFYYPLQQGLQPHNISIRLSPISKVQEISNNEELTESNVHLDNYFEHVAKNTSHLTEKVSQTSALNENQYSTASSTSSFLEEKISKNTEQEKLFLHELDAKIRASLVYPKRAQQRNIEGLVSILISINTSGTLQTVEVVSSSGSSILDSAALELLENIFPLFTKLHETLTTEITILYELN